MLIANLLRQLLLLLYWVANERCGAGIRNLYHYTVADAVVMLVEYDSLVLLGTTT